MDDMAALLRRQSGVVARRQLVDAGLPPHAVRRLLRRRELVTLIPGVYVDHTGVPSWTQRAWADVLALWPAALCGASALGPPRSADERDLLIHVAVDRQRSPACPPGFLLHRQAGLDARVMWNVGPPRLRIEEAVIDVAVAAPDQLAAFTVLADAVQSRRTTAPRIASALADRVRIPRRDFLAGVLTDIESGTCSVLEHGYLTRVERPHGLPKAGRQVLDARRGSVYRDVEYAGLGLVVELDGRLFHDTALAHDADLERDLDVAVDGRTTVRIGWGQVFRRPCQTAAKLAGVFRTRSWDGARRRCPSC